MCKIEFLPVFKQFLTAFLTIPQQKRIMT